MTDASFSIRVAVTLIVMAAIIVASLIPGRTKRDASVFVRLVARTPHPLQKLMHVLLYGILTVMLAWTLDASQVGSMRFFVAAAVAVCFGAVLEWYQTKVPGRFGTIFDMALNAAGVLLGLLVAIRLF